MGATGGQGDSRATGGVGLGGLLGLLFIGLKLGGAIAWPWLWVLAPFWIPIALVLAILLVAGLVHVATK